MAILHSLQSGWLRTSYARVMAILWEAAQGLGIPSSFSLHVFHFSNVFKIFHPKIPPGDCASVAGQRGHGYIPSSPTTMGEQGLVFGTESETSPYGGSIPRRKPDFFNISG